MSAVLFVIAAATDWFDGHLARRWNVTSKLGSFLDTTADKLLVSGVLIALLAEGRVSPWIVAIIVGRELVLMGLRGLIASEGEVMAPSMLGKLKTSIQFLGDHASPSCGPAIRSAGSTSTSGRCSWPRRSPCGRRSTTWSGRSPC